MLRQMAPAQRFIRFSGSSRQAVPPSPPQSRKYKTISDILERAKYAVLEQENYNDVKCEQCGSGEEPDQLLLCNKCDNGFHMKCLRPIVVKVPIGSWLCPNCCRQRTVRRFSQKKIFDFFRIEKCRNDTKTCALQNSRKRRRRSRPLAMQKRRRRLSPYVPEEDPSSRMKQMASLASALVALQMKFSDDLTYLPGLAPRSANKAKLEKDGMQILTKEDTETLEYCRSMARRGACRPLLVVFDSCEGFTVHADGPIKDLMVITEYTGDVDYLKNRERDDRDSMMTLLLAKDPSKSLVICPDKRGNITCFISGINNHTAEGRKKKNCKCVRYDVNEECRVLLVTTRDITKGERLYYDYNGFEQEYPTHLFL